MNITQIENNLSKLIKNFDKNTFIYDLLLAYNLPKATITRLQVTTEDILGAKLLKFIILLLERFNNSKFSA